MRIEKIGNATRIYALCEYPSMVPRYVGRTLHNCLLCGNEFKRKANG